jgi:hypothetical protein
MTVVRVSMGRIDPSRADEIIAALRASEGTLRPAISSLPGLIAYYVGIDRDTSAITNTSVWQTRDHAMTMNGLLEMDALRKTFERLGVTFQPIANHDVLWEI